MLRGLFRCHSERREESAFGSRAGATENQKSNGKRQKCFHPSFCLAGCSDVILSRYDSATRSLRSRGGGRCRKLRAKVCWFSLAVRAGAPSLNGRETREEFEVTNCDFKTRHPCGAHRAVHLPDSRAEGHAQHGLGAALRSCSESIGSGSQAQPWAVPRGLHVPDHQRRVRRLEITICDFKLGW